MKDFAQKKFNEIAAALCAVVFFMLFCLPSFSYPPRAKAVDAPESVVSFPGFRADFFPDIHGLAYEGGFYYVADAENGLYIYNAALELTGRDAGMRGPVAAADGYVFEGQAVFFSASDNEYQIFNTSGPAISYARADSAGGIIPPGAPTPLLTASGTVTALTVYGDTLVYAVKISGSYSKIFTYDLPSSAPDTGFDVYDEISALGADNGFIYAAVGNSVFKYDYLGAVDKELSFSEEKDFKNPTALCVYGGFVLIADKNDRQIRKYSSSLEYIDTLFASRGSEDGRLKNPNGTAARDGTVYIADTGNQRVQIWREDGSLYKIGGFISPLALAVDGAGNIYVIDNKTAVKTFGPDFTSGTVYNSFGATVNLTDITAAPDAVYLADAAGGRILRLLD